MLGSTKLFEAVNLALLETIFPPMFAISIVILFDPIFTVPTFDVAVLLALSGIAPPAQLLALLQLPEVPPIQATEPNWVMEAVTDLTVDKV